MNTIFFKVPKEYNNITVKGFLRGFCGISARTLSKLKQVQNGITVDGNLRIATDLLKSGNIVILQMPEDKKYSHLCKPVHKIKILYEDNDYLIIDKPPDSIIYPRPGHNENETVMATVMDYLISKGENISFRPLYRLDKDTTGALLIAKNRVAAFIEEDNINKTYYAVCEGVLKGEGVIDKPISLLKNSLKRCVCSNGVRAITKWKAIYSENNHTLVKFHLQTGRTHQIRVHMSYLGYPLAGDDFYGGKTNLIKSQALHCGNIEYINSITKIRNKVNSPFPCDFYKILPNFNKELIISI